MCHDEYLKQTGYVQGVQKVKEIKGIKHKNIQIFLDIIRQKAYNFVWCFIKI